MGSPARTTGIAPRGAFRRHRGRSRRLVGLTVAVVASGLAGCGPLVRMEPPSAQGPRISNLEFVPDRGTVGCPVQIRFRFEASAGDVAQVVAGWVGGRRGSRGAGRSVLAPDEEALRGNASGGIVTPLTFDRAGRYWYNVQVQDRAGRWSNVLSGTIPVDSRSSGEERDCP